MMDIAWALVRMTPLTLFEIDLVPPEKQIVPEWSGINVVVQSHSFVLIF